MSGRLLYIFPRSSIQVASSSSKPFPVVGEFCKSDGIFGSFIIPEEMREHYQQYYDVEILDDFVVFKDIAIICCRL